MPEFVRSLILLALSSLLMSTAFPASLGTEKTGDDEKNRVMALHLEIVTPHEDAELKDFKARFTKVLWHNWLVVMPEDAQLGAAGIVVIRFQIEKDRSQSVESPLVEQGAGEKHKSLTKAALSAIRDSTKSTHLPDGFARSSVELRAIFSYNQPSDSVKR
jgi:hypothetical protein